MAKDTFFSKKKTINCKGRLLFLDEPQVMGILNLTPDSFYDGGSYQNEKQLLTKTEQYINEGASILDLGAYSSRPGAKHISETEELERLIPAIKSIIKTFPETIISIDTFRSEIAKQAIESGASIINDISAGDMDNRMIPTIADLNVPYIIMHMQGTPQTMQTSPTYSHVASDVIKYFSKKLKQLHLVGINDIILDPGFGFGKTITHNYQLLSEIDQFNILEQPILVGISRKSMIYKTLNTSPQEALNGTTGLHMYTLLKNVNILRVHDVKETVEIVKIVEQLKMS